MMKFLNLLSLTGSQFMKCKQTMNSVALREGNYKINKVERIKPPGTYYNIKFNSKDHINSLAKKIVSSATNVRIMPN